MTAVRVALAAAALAAAAVGAQASEPTGRSPTPEERRMMDLRLVSEGFAPCAEVSLVAARWSCRARDAAGQHYRLSLSNLDFAVISRQRVE